MLPEVANTQNMAQLPDIKEAYPLIETGLLSSEQWTYVWMAVAAPLTLCLFYLLYRWMKRPQPEETSTPLERACEALLHAENALAQGEFKTFSQKLSLALRGYIEARHRIPALELTTEEFANTIHGRSYFKDTDAQQLIDTLQSCDTLKFSTTGANEETLKRLLESARAFIRRESEAQEEPEA